MYLYLISEVKSLLDTDLGSWFVTALLIIGVIVGLCKLGSEFLSWIGKPIGWAKQRKEDHEMILKNCQAIKDLAELHSQDNKLSKEHDTKLRDEMSEFMSEVRADIKKLTENRVRDKEQSVEIQKELSDSIRCITDKNETRDNQINSLIIAQKEMLAEKINQKYKYYLSIKGIPEDEYDEFVSMHTAYKQLGGNSNGDAKFEYCMNHLTVIPVETKLIIKHDNK